MLNVESWYLSYDDAGVCKLNTRNALTLSNINNDKLQTQGYIFDNLFGLFLISKQLKDGNL